ADAAGHRGGVLPARLPGGAGGRLGVHGLRRVHRLAAFGAAAAGRPPRPAQPPQRPGARALHQLEHADDAEADRAGAGRRAGGGCARAQGEPLKVYVVRRLNWEYGDDFWYREEAGDAPVETFLDRAKAEARRRELEWEHVQEEGVNPFGYID